MTKQVVKFDPVRPYASVHGQPGLAYQQDGHTFNGKGELVTPAEQAKLLPVDAPEPKPTPDDGSIPRCYVAVSDEPEDKQEEQHNKGLETMHWKRLQKMCNLYGIDYVNREQAVAALRGR